MDSEYTRSGRTRSSVNSPHHMDAKEKESIKAEIRKEVQEQLQSQFNAILKHMNLSSLSLPPITPVDSCSHKKDAGDDPLVEGEIPSPTHADSRESANLTPDPFPDVKEETPCELLHLGKNMDGELVGYGSAQPFDKVHFKSNTSTHYISVGINSIVPGFEDLPLPVPREEYNFLTLLDAKSSFVPWPRDRVRLIGGFANENQSSKRKKVENPKSKNVQPPKNMEQGQGLKGEHLLKKSSRGSETSCTPLVEADVLHSLSKACTFLHNHVSELPRGRSIAVNLPKALFHYDEDRITFITRVDVKEFLTGAMLNISIIQAFMRALQEHLISGCNSEAAVGWLCPEQTSITRCLCNPRDMEDYLERSVKESTRAGDKFILAPCFEDAH